MRQFLVHISMNEQNAMGGSMKNKFPTDFQTREKHAFK